MHFSTVFLLSTAAMSVMSSPLNDVSRSLSEGSLFARDGLTLLDSADRGNGSKMEYYGVSGGAQKREDEPGEPADLQDRSDEDGEGDGDVQPTPTIAERGTKCSASPTASCDTKNNQAQNSLCANLLDDLNAQYDTSVPSSWRQICYRGTDGSCCTGWNTQVNYLKQGTLAANVQTLNEQCSANGISGKIYGTKLSYTCVNQCVNSGHTCS
ncbi:hypothetical protein F4778DRAFT_796727 [Xylariomycetidae sp. FL2044]|nr:hypothetical protein F4778DRAFT_796727 [Xylariomycetidae sp. FL2044]